MTGGSGFSPPPYPYDRLDSLAVTARQAFGELVDLSVGTPCDAPPPAVVAALSSSGAERGYPASVGSPEFRQAAASYLERRFAVLLDPPLPAACVGTKEFVASAAWYLRLRRPERDTVLGPALSYPTYALSASLAGARYVAVPQRADGAPDLGSLGADDAQRALMLWVNSPANPSGAVFDVEDAVRWGRGHDVPVLADECYAEFTWDRPPATVLSHGAEGVLAVHSLSKRSNMAGVRVGFYAGDGELVSYLSEVRKHAGLMVPGPVQNAAVVALNDDEHVEQQRARYRLRLETLAGALERCGLEAHMPAGGFYLWVAVPPWATRVAHSEGRGGDWVLAESLARGAGMLVSPGEFYGSDAFVRIALVVPDDQLARAVSRLESCGQQGLVRVAGVPGAGPAAR